MESEIFFGKNLHYLRKAKKLSGSELGDIIGVGKSMIGYYEQNKSEPPLRTIIKVADFFGVSIDSLLRVNISSKSGNSSTVGDMSMIQMISRINKMEMELQQMKMQMEGKSMEMRKFNLSENQPTPNSTPKPTPISKSEN